LRFWDLHRPGPTPVIRDENPPLSDKGVIIACIPFAAAAPVR
jgi:hypothetical protein